MLPPYELQNKPFKTALKGYNTVEVDEHLEFVNNKYTELYRAYNDLERRFSACEAELEQFRKNEDAIRRALVNAQNAGARIMREAGDRSQLILQSTKESCKEILADFEKEIQQKQDMLQALKTQVFEFKSRMFSLYREHIEFLEAISPEAEEGGQWQLAPEDYVSKVIGQVVLDVDSAEKENPTVGLTDPPKIRIDDETLESLMSNAGTKSADRTVASEPPRSSSAARQSSFSDTQAVNLAEIRQASAKAAPEQRSDLTLEAAKEDTVIFGRPKP